MQSNKHQVPKLRVITAERAAYLSAFYGEGGRRKFARAQRFRQKRQFDRMREKV